jgi:hypothetical protein
MTWQRVAALGLLIGGAVVAAIFYDDVIAATLAGAAAGFAVNREPDRNGSSPVPLPLRLRSSSLTVQQAHPGGGLHTRATIAAAPRG